MVSEEDFIYINNKINENKRKTKGYNNEKIANPRPLNGDVYCSECDFKLSGYVRKKKVKTTGLVNEMHYYKCFKCGAIHVNANTTKHSKSEGLHDQFNEILKSFVIEKELTMPIVIQLKKIINSRNKEVIKINTATKKKISELKKELETVEHRFAMGKIPENLYDKFANKYADEIFELEQNISGDGKLTSNLTKKIETVIKETSNLSEIWTSGCLETKKSIQKLVFPNGMVVESKNKRLRTHNVNKLIVVILRITDICSINKKGTINVKTDKSLLAENEGFEPPVPRGTTVFKTAAFDHSANSPKAGQKYNIFFKYQIL